MRDGFQQHDVQEFCRVLFDAIEQSVESTDQANMIKKLYEGSYIDYVKCLNCLRESSREDKFLDLSLTVRNDFDKIYNDSIEKALANYIRPEELTGSNQYYCEHCGGKQDAIKGLKFKSLPYILVLQLKRFDLDYETFQRIKLNDKVTFPQILNMNPFVREIPHGDPERIEIESEHSEEEEIPMVIPKNLDDLQLVHSKISTYDTIGGDFDKKPLKLDKVAKEKHIAMRAEEKKHERAKMIHKYREDGEDVYELYSIMIHSGSANGGHYYAYIKSFETERWYDFDDSSVKEIDEKDIEKVFGGETKSYGWSSSYSTNAYLLMYRKVDESRNILRVEDSEIPPYILEEIEHERNKEREELNAREEKRKNIKLRIFYQGKEKELEINREMLVKELKLKAMEEFSIPAEEEKNVRVRNYSQYYDTNQEVLDEERSIESENIYTQKNLALETKKNDEVFEDYDPNKFTIKVIVWDPKFEDENLQFDQKIANPIKFFVDKRVTIKKMMLLFEEKLGIPFSKQKILKKSFISSYCQPEVISLKYSYDQSLSLSRIYDGSFLFIEEIDDISVKSKWQIEFEKEQSKIAIKFNDPSQVTKYLSSPDFKESITIHSQKTVGDMKALIAAHLGIAQNEFIMKRGSLYGGELKDLTLKISMANIMNNSFIYIEKGIPTNPNEIRLVFSLAVPPKENEGDGAVFSFEDTFEMSVNIYSKILEIKQMVCEKLKKLHPTIDINPLNIRLRERVTEKLAKPYENNDTLSTYHTFDRKNIGIQVLEEEEKSLEYYELIVVVKQWNPSTWELSPPKEITVNKHWRVSEFGAKLSEIYNIPPEYIEVAKIAYS
mmetsp:Transcript_26095/g.25717  ORF Transcript_26095/g.25717 Transcript_26095/m.25717 type:complete len:835 (-) Transcript_26095:354-2858(-)